MTRYYPNKNPGHQRDSKKGDRNGKKGGDSKPEDKDNNAVGTAGADVGDATTPKGSTATVGLVLTLMFWKPPNRRISHHGL